MYRVFLWIHTLSYISWLIAFVASMYFAYKVGKAYESSDEKLFMQRERKATSIGAHIGAIGILISGGAMASMHHWGWFPFHQFTWLAVKQSIFVVILILVGVSIKHSVSFKKALRKDENNLVNRAARKKWKKAYKISLAVYLLVVLNVYLGLAKPF